MVGAFRIEPSDTSPNRGQRVSHPGLSARNHSSRRPGCRISQPGQRDRVAQHEACRLRVRGHHHAARPDGKRGSLRIRAMGTDTGGQRQAVDPDAPLALTPDRRRGARRPAHPAADAARCPILGAPCRTIRDTHPLSLSMTYLGHSTVLIDIGGVRVLTDPILRRRVGPAGARQRPHRPGVLEPGGRGAHLPLPLGPPGLRLAAAARATRCPWSCPGGWRARLRARGFREVIEVVPGDDMRVAGLTIEATRALHRGFGPPIGPTELCVGFLAAGHPLGLLRGGHRAVRGHGRTRPGHQPGPHPGLGLGTARGGTEAPRPARRGTGAPARAAAGRCPHPLGHAAPHRPATACARRRASTRPTSSHGWRRSWPRTPSCGSCPSVARLSLDGDLSGRLTKTAMRSRTSSEDGLEGVPQPGIGDQLGGGQIARPRHGATGRCARTDRTHPTAAARARRWRGQWLLRSSQAGSPGRCSG